MNTSLQVYISYSPCGTTVKSHLWNFMLNKICSTQNVYQIKEVDFCHCSFIVTYRVFCHCIVTHKREMPCYLTKNDSCIHLLFCLHSVYWSHNESRVSHKYYDCKRAHTERSIWLGHDDFKCFWRDENRKGIMRKRNNGIVLEVYRAWFWNYLRLRHKPQFIK